jgi:lipopolysaccharide/colanic/teichoic acid biosynthesis glycosyltransferase
VNGFYARAGKRAFDAVTASLLVVLLSPVLAAVAITVRIALGRPVLFHQPRPGRGGKPFELIKFRTMANAAGQRGIPLSDDVRLSRFGRLLRSSSLDELPELWNVLKGEMSIVGPRPLLMDYLPLYSPEQARLHQVRPGITGWAQVNGRNAQSWDQRFALDVWYVDHLSLVLDIKILLKTVVRVLTRHGIASEGHVTMPKFTGQAR